MNFKKIICIGDLNADLLVPYGEAKRLRQEAEKGKAVRPARVVLQSGGTMGNVCSVLGRLGDHPYFVTDLCADAIGRFLRQDLKAQDVDFSFSVCGDNQTIVCIAVLENGERLILPWLPPQAELPRFRAKQFTKVPREDVLLVSSGMILTNDEDLAKKINSAIFPGIQGGPLEHVVAAKAVSFKEVLDPAFKEYAANVIKNSKAMADVFLQDPDFRIISGGTENHLFLVDVTKVVENGKVAQNLLDEVNITLNKNSIPYESLSPFKTSGIRIGAAAITARGFGEEESRKVAELIIKTLKNAENEAVLEEVRSAVKELTDAFPLYED